MKLTINGQESLSMVIGKLRDTFKDKKYFSVTIHTGKNRTISQNSLQHAWYLQVSREEAEYTPAEIKRLCKYRYGLPILRGDDAEFNEVCARVIDPLVYESRILAMEYLPVTSLMSTKQLSEYMEQVQNHYAGRVQLEFPL